MREAEFPTTGHSLCGVYCPVPCRSDWLVLGSSALSHATRLMQSVRARTASLNCTFIRFSCAHNAARERAPPRSEPRSATLSPASARRACYAHSAPNLQEPPSFAFSRARPSVTGLSASTRDLKQTRLSLHFYFPGASAHSFDLREDGRCAFLSFQQWGILSLCNLARMLPLPNWH